MRTTILLPDELYRQVRLTAAAEERTITSVIEEAVRSALRARDQPVHPSFQITPLGGPGLLPGVDLDHNSALMDLMDGSDQAGQDARA